MARRASLWIALAGLNGFMAVAAGAFGAHGASHPEAKTLLHTGAQYQAVHAVAALACLGLGPASARQAATAGWLFDIGGLLFGGSLYLLAFGAPRVMGLVTPAGGLLMLAGWATLTWSALAGAKATR